MLSWHKCENTNRLSTYRAKDRATQEEGTNLLCGIVVTPFLWMCQATMPHMGIHRGRRYLLVGLTITIPTKMRTSSLKLTMSTHQWTY